MKAQEELNKIEVPETLTVLFEGVPVKLKLVYSVLVDVTEQATKNPGDNLRPELLGSLIYRMNKQAFKNGVDIDADLSHEDVSRVEEWLVNAAAVFSLRRQLASLTSDTSKKLVSVMRDLVEKPTNTLS
jgi:hypothetical protein